MKKHIYIWILGVVLMASSCTDFLEKYPLDQMTNDNFWTTEANVEMYAWDFYPNSFPTYGSGWTWGRFFTGQSLNDDFAPSSPAQFTQNEPSTDGNWDYDYIRRANLMLSKIDEVGMETEAANHWKGVARFFRGLEHYELVKRFGDVPWQGVVSDPENKDYLYKPRDARTLVMDSVLADFEFAANNVRAVGGNQGVEVDRYVVLAIMSRTMLFEGTWQRYHGGDAAYATKFLNAAKDAAKQVIDSGIYSLGGSYREEFNSLDLAANQGIILYRTYATGLLTHVAHTYNDVEAQTGPSKNLIDGYLCADGLPIGLSAVYEGDKNIVNTIASRDGRLAETFVTDETALRLKGETTVNTTTGYSTHKFKNEAISGTNEGQSNLNPTDGPTIRYAEVLINYAEASAELGTLTQSDLDLTINKLRDREAVALPHLQVVGGNPAVGGVVYDDPARDLTVSSLLWEIRRERRNELVFEGFRLDDLRRWKKLEYTDTEDNSTINRGAWIVASEHPDMVDVVIENESTVDGEVYGYIRPSTAIQSQRRFDPSTDSKVYLYPIPLAEITLYDDNGYVLTQNDGWRSGLE